MNLDSLLDSCDSSDRCDNRSITQMFHPTNLEIMHWMTPQRNEPLRGQRYPIYVLVVLGIPPFLSFRWTIRFLFTGHFETSALSDPPNDLEHNKVHVASTYVLLVSPSPKFQSFSLYSSTTNRFRNTVQFVTIAPNDFKITLSTTRSMISVYVSSVTKFSIVTCFALWPVVSSYRPFWGFALYD